MVDQREERTRLECEGVPNPGPSLEGRGQSGTFEIVAITQGEGNGWKFSAEVLRKAAALMNGVECFVDHAWSGHSVRDLAGVCIDPAWDAERMGILCKLKAVGPSGPLLAALGRELLAEGEQALRVGFSADVVFTAKGKEVQEIMRFNSLDLVFNPARGGAFVRALNSLSTEELSANGANNREFFSEKEGVRMGEEKNDVLGQARLDAQAKALEEAQTLRVQMSGYLVESALGAAKLPSAMAARVRAQFAGKAATAEEVNGAIEDARKLVSELTGAGAVQGPGRVHAMFDSTDRIQAAVEDLFGVERSEGLQKVQATRLSGIRELYLGLTGDYDLHGGFYAERAQFATTADFTGLVKNAMNKIVAEQWTKLGRAGYDWWQRVTAQEHFTSLQSITGTLIGTVGTLPVVAEGAEYGQLPIGDSPETASFTKYGGYIPLTLELIDRDEVRKLREYPRELASAGLRRISSLVAAVFTDNAGVGPTMADSGALFNATAVTTAGGHANLLTTALSSSQWDVVGQAVYNQPMLIKNEAGLIGTGPKMAINPRFCLVPRALDLTARQVLYPSWEHTANIYSENMQQGRHGDVVIVPEWTDANNWAAVCDPALAPSVYVGERFGIMPEIFIASNELSPAVFMNDEHRLKVRQFVAVWVNDFRPVHKSNVA